MKRDLKIRGKFISMRKIDDFDVLKTSVDHMKHRMDNGVRYGLHKHKTFLNCDQSQLFFTKE